MLATAPQPDPDRERVLRLLEQLGIIGAGQSDAVAHLTYDELIDLAGEYHEAVGEMRVWVSRRFVRPRSTPCHRSRLRLVTRLKRHCGHAPARYKHAK